MERPASGPGAALVLLRRHATTTDVMIVGIDGDAAPLPCAVPRSDASQLSVLEDLIRECGAGAVDRLYASALSVPGKDGPLGLFVGFASERTTVPPDAAWMDLREACRDLAPIWSAALSAVRQRFVARPPDEALRIR